MCRLPSQARDTSALLALPYDNNPFRFSQHRQSSTYRTLYHIFHQMSSETASPKIFRVDESTSNAPFSRFSVFPPPPPPPTAKTKRKQQENKHKQAKTKQFYKNERLRKENKTRRKRAERRQYILYLYIIFIFCNTKRKYSNLLRLVLLF